MMYEQGALDSMYEAKRQLDEAINLYERCDIKTAIVHLNSAKEEIDAALSINKNNEKIRVSSPFERN